MNLSIIVVLMAALVLGILFALSTSFLLTMLAIKKSNNLGDGKGTFRTFAVNKMKYYKKVDHINENQKYDYFNRIKKA